MGLGTYAKCNRCKISKKEVIETEEQKEENNIENYKMDNAENNNYYNYNTNAQQYNKKNKYRFKKY